MGVTFGRRVTSVRSKPVLTARTTGLVVGDGTPAIVLRASMAQQRCFVWLYPEPALSTRYWANSSGSAGSQVDPLPSAKGTQEPIACAYRFHVGPAFPAATACCTASERDATGLPGFPPVAAALMSFLAGTMRGLPRLTDPARRAVTASRSASRRRSSTRGSGPAIHSDYQNGLFAKEGTVLPREN